MCACAGGKGPLVEEEARLFRLRQEVEGEAREEFQRARLQLEDEARTSSSGKLCATPFGVDVVGITEVIALTGALVGGPPLSHCPETCLACIQQQILCPDCIMQTCSDTPRAPCSACLQFVVKVCCVTWISNVWRLKMRQRGFCHAEHNLFIDMKQSWRKQLSQTTLCGAGISARARKAELERLNDQLRKINMSLRQQARAGTVYAPGLNYAPLPLPPSPSKRSGDAATPVAELTDTAIQLINGVQVPPCFFDLVY